MNKAHRQYRDAAESLGCRLVGVEGSRHGPVFVLEKDGQTVRRGVPMRSASAGDARIVKNWTAQLRRALQGGGGDA